MRSHVFAPRSARQNARAEALVTPAWVTAVPVPSSLQPCIVPIKPRWVVAASACSFSACYSRSAKTHTGTSLQQGFPVSAFWGLGVPRKWLTRSGSGRNRCACWCGHNCRLRWHELSEGGSGSQLRGSQVSVSHAPPTVPAVEAIACGAPQRTSFLQQASGTVTERRVAPVPPAPCLPVLLPQALTTWSHFSREPQRHPYTWTRVSRLSVGLYAYVSSCTEWFAKGLC